MKTITLTLTDEQAQEMEKAAKVYSLTLEKACYFGLFNFEFKLDPSSGTEGWDMLHDLQQAHDPQKAFEERHRPEVPEWLLEKHESDSGNDTAESNGDQAA